MWKKDKLLERVKRDVASSPALQRMCNSDMSMHSKVRMK